MRLSLFIGSGLLFMGIADMPSGYYTFLRIAVTVSSIIVIYNEYSYQKGLNFWIVLFGITAIIFNPIIPVYFYDKGLWMMIDGAGGILYAAKAISIGK